MSVHYFGSQSLSIHEAELSYDKLARALCMLSLGAEIEDDDYVCVSEGLKWPIWLVLQPDVPAVRLYSFIELSPASSLPAIATYCNETYSYAQFSVGKSHDRVHACAYHFYDEMILLKPLVRQMQYFALTVHDAYCDECI